MSRAATRADAERCFARLNLGGMRPRIAEYGWLGAGTRPVTPEVAGSSSIAPVSLSACKTASFVAYTDRDSGSQRTRLLPGISLIGLLRAESPANQLFHGAGASAGAPAWTEKPVSRAGGRRDGGRYPIACGTFAARAPRRGSPAARPSSAPPTRQRAPVATMPSSSASHEGPTSLNKPFSTVSIAS